MLHLKPRVPKLESKSEQGLDMEVSDDDSKQKPSGNRNHSALTWQKKRNSWLQSGTVPSSEEETGPNGTATLVPVYSICIQATSSYICGATRVECDSHADTSVLAKEALIIHDYGRPVSVYSYDKEDGCKEYRTVSAAVAYDHPQTGQVYMLVINQAIKIPLLQNHSLCPMQCWLNGIKISEMPEFLAEDPDESTHSLQVVDPLDDSSPLFIPLSLTGVTSYFPVRKPTIAEWENEAT